MAGSASERQEQALTLRRAGATYRQIAAALKTDPGNAYRLTQRALTRTLKEPADAVRRLEVERLDALLTSLWPAASRGHFPAVDRVLRIMERRASLLGLDAPARVDLRLLLRDEAARLAADLGLDTAAVVAEAERILQSGGTHGAR